MGTWKKSCWSIRPCILSWYTENNGL